MTTAAVAKSNILTIIWPFNILCLFLSQDWQGVAFGFCFFFQNLQKVLCRVWENIVSSSAGRESSVMAFMHQGYELKYLFRQRTE